MGNVKLIKKNTQKKEAKMAGTLQARVALLVVLVLMMITATTVAEDWLQFKYDCRHSGDVPDRSVTTPLGLVAAVPLTDAVFTAPVVANGRVYVVDGAGVAFCIDARTLEILWKFETDGGRANCNNISSPAIAGGYLHFGTMAGAYYVLDAANGTLVEKIQCGEPIFSAAVATNNRVYFATLGSQVYALEPEGTICWVWDYVRERLGFEGNRWSGADWLKHKKGKRVNWRDQFCCSRNIAAYENIIVVPAGGETICLKDLGDKAELGTVALVPDYAGSELPATFGQSIDETGAIYRQWHRRDNTGRVEILRIVDDRVKTDYVRGTQAEINRPNLLSFCSVSVRGTDVYRCRPEEGFGFCKHSAAVEKPQHLGGYPSIAAPILLRNNGVYGALDGKLYVVPLAGTRKVWSFKTAFGKAISAPVAVCDGRIYFGCEDGYLYILGPQANAPLPSKEIELCKIRSPLKGKLADSKYDWFTNYGDLSSTNFNEQGIKPPFKIKWIRRYEGTFKHVPVCGGGRMYTNTAEGQIFAVEQETGRLLWRRYWPGVHLSFTSPLYYKGRLLVPQAGMKRSRLRCLDAATGKLLWETPFTGTPSWSRQMPPVIHKNLAIYPFGTGKFAAQGSDKNYLHKGTPVESPDGSEISSWIYNHDNPHYPKGQKSLVRAWDIETGEEIWNQDFSRFGSGGNDAGVCLMDGVLYYSCFFGYAPKTSSGLPRANGITAAIDPANGEIIWLTTRYSVTAGTTISAKNGRLYLGGHNKLNEQTEDRYVWCLDARDGSLIWRSEPLAKAVNVVTIGKNILFAHGSSRNPSYLIDKDTGKILLVFDEGYACTRFTLSGPYLLGANMDIIDTSNNAGNLISSGPCVDARDCVGAIASNGRLFYTSQANGLQLSRVCGDQAELQ
jgi:outer membrane protein assembly factor BamB